MHSNDIKVLYVDDEVNNLQSFKATFRLQYKVYTAASADEAIVILDEHPDIKVILCDQRMPNVTGIEFLEKVRRFYPKVVRMLITGYTDIESVIGAINRGHVYRYIKKPWVEQELHAAIEEGNKYYHTHSLLVKKNEELQNAYNALDEFTFSITHGLRDPILSVISIVEMAKNTENVTTDVVELLDMVCQSMMQLDTFIKNTHDYHKINKGQVELEPIWLKEVLTDVADIYEIEAVVNNVGFEVNIHQDEEINSSVLILNMIVNNLLSNAFKSFNSSQADRSVSLDINAGKEAINILIKDNSTGLPESYIKDVFDAEEKRYEVHRTTLSLNNVKEAVALLGGTISYRLEGKTNTYEVVIPVKK